MSIYDLVVSRHLCKVDESEQANIKPQLRFSLPATDVMMSPDGRLVVALSRVDGRFVAQRGNAYVVGRVDIPLTSEQVKTLECE